MAILQRQPFEVHAVENDQAQTDEILRQATAKLLRASGGPLPFAGAIIRSALGQDEINQQIKDSQNSHPQLSSIVEPIREVVREHWSQHPASQSLKLQNLFLHHFETTRGRLGHIDQSMKDGWPEDGPISALLALKGSVRYNLSVVKADVFTPEGAEKVRLYHEKRFDLGATVDLHPGDVLIFTNNPPTHHESEADPDRITAIHFTRFHPVEQE
jgi:hypothetical protein